MFSLHQYTFVSWNFCCVYDNAADIRRVCTPLADMTQIEFDDRWCNFVHMLVERQEKLERAVDDLTCVVAKITENSHDIFLDPTTKFTCFSDGYKLIWSLLKHVKMQAPKEQGGRLTDIDDVHLDAIVTGEGKTFSLPMANCKNCIYIGHPCRPLRLGEMIKRVEEIIVDRYRHDYHMTWAESQHTPLKAMLCIPDHDLFRGLETMQQSTPICADFRLVYGSHRDNKAI